MASKVFVGNLDWNTTREEIEAVFAQAGELRDVFLPIDRVTGRKRGFAFVEFANSDDAAAAIERFNEYEIGGRPIRVNLAEDRPQRSPSFGGGDRPSFGGDRSPFDSGGGRGGRQADKFGGAGKPKGSRRNIRSRKRGL